MGMFNWGKNDAPAADEHSQSLGTGAADSGSTPNQGSVSANTRASAGASAREEIKARRGRPAKSSDPARVSDAELSERVNAQIASQLEALHAPELWASILCLPADGMLALTGKERWELSKTERNTMGLSGSALARTMMITNPRALAAFMFISVMSTAYLPRALAEMKDIAAKKKAEAAAKGAAPDAVAKS